MVKGPANRPFEAATCYSKRQLLKRLADDAHNIQICAADTKIECDIIHKVVNFPLLLKKVLMLVKNVAETISIFLH